MTALSKEKDAKYKAILRRFCKVRNIEWSSMMAIYYKQSAEERFTCILQCQQWLRDYDEGQRLKRADEIERRQSEREEEARQAERARAVRARAQENGVFSTEQASRDNRPTIELSARSVSEANRPYAERL